MASRVGLACDERMCKAHGGDFSLSREELSRIISTSPHLESAGIPERYDPGEFFPKGNEGNFDQVGIGKGSGYNINGPLPHGGFGNADNLAFSEHIVMPVARDFNPDMTLISAGFDSASGDPVGGCNVTPDGYARMTQQWPSLQFDIDDGLCVRAPMDERELKKQFPLQALLQEIQGPNEEMENSVSGDFLLVPEF